LLNVAVLDILLSSFLLLLVKGICYQCKCL